MSVLNAANVAPQADPVLITGGYIEIKVRGKATKVPAAQICGRTVITSGRWIKIAKLRDEELVEGDRVPDPESFVSGLKNTTLNADIVTFAESLPNTTPRHGYRCEWDNLAVIPVSSYKEWWGRLSDPVQRAVKKAKRVGVVVKEVEFTDAFIKEIQGVYDESPVRQGRIFWHYQKDFETVKAENATYFERNIFIGAYCDNELIGFIRMISVGKAAEIIQILSKQGHQDKRPTNALIAKAVEVCEQRGFSYLVYCNYVYKDPNSSLTEFKRRNRFEQILLPRYYIPLTFKGRVALQLKLHHGVKGLVPTPVVGILLRARAWFTESIIAPLRTTKTASHPGVQA